MGDSACCKGQFLWQPPKSCVAVEKRLLPWIWLNPKIFRSRDFCFFFSILFLSGNSQSPSLLVVWCWVAEPLSVCCASLLCDVYVGLCFRLMLMLTTKRTHSRGDEHGWGDRGVFENSTTNGARQQRGRGLISVCISVSSTPNWYHFDGSLILFSYILFCLKISICLSYRLDFFSSLQVIQYPEDSYRLLLLAVGISFLTLCFQIAHTCLKHLTFFFRFLFFPALNSNSETCWTCYMLQ